MRLVVVVVALVLAGCAAEPPRLSYPAFEGHESDVWLAYELRGQCDALLQRISEAR